MMVSECEKLKLIASKKLYQPYFYYADGICKIAKLQICRNLKFRLI
jgi:hypothetical protein